jgi:hypothetical protein
VRKIVGTEWELVFTIPEVMTVPGVGADTLEAPQGLALDDTHVYVVESGPELGRIESNAWFKFERDGTPVSSSKATDFVAGIVAPPDDAVVDGITWCPPSSPFAPGLFLVAVEHTGILVIDADGFVVDDIVWAEAGLTYGLTVPFAFAGLTVDPLRGDLYLVENSDGGGCHVWVRVPDDTSFYLGSISRIHIPDTECSRRLLYSDPPSGLVFGLAYREQDGLVWGTGFSSGDLVGMDPISGKVVTVIPHGGWPVNVWGVTHDPVADDLYMYGNDNRLYRIDDLEAPVATPLPELVGSDWSDTDIAWNPDDGFIYAATSFGGENSLVRIDPTTGAGQALGELEVTISGLTYDPRFDALVGIESGSANQGMYVIELPSGESSFLGDSPTPSGWEGLVLLNPPADILGLGEGASTPGATLLRAAPNPFRSAIRLGLPGDWPSGASVTIHDAGGRELRRWSSIAGAGEITWDGCTAAGASVAPGIYFARVAGHSAQAGATKVVRIR